MIITVKDAEQYARNGMDFQISISYKFKELANK